MSDEPKKRKEHMVLHVEPSQVVVTLTAPKGSAFFQVTLRDGMPASEIADQLRKLSDYIKLGNQRNHGLGNVRLSVETTAA